MLGLIDRILDLSKIEAGKMGLYLETFDVRAMIDDLISAMDALVRKNNNALSVTFGQPLGTMRADLTKTRQILFNLLNNAAKLTTGGAVSLRVDRRSVGAAIGSSSSCRIPASAFPPSSRRVSSSPSLKATCPSRASTAEPACPRGS